MTNEELSKRFREKVPEAAPLDFFDRCVDIGIYFNETIDEGEGKDALIDVLEDTMVRSYKAR